MFVITAASFYLHPGEWDGPVLRDEGVCYIAGKDLAEVQYRETLEASPKVVTVKAGSEVWFQGGTAHVSGIVRG